MTFDSFIEDLKSEVDKFRDFYLEGMKKEPKHWPNEMSESDWYEQFIMFTQFQEGDK